MTTTDKDEHNVDDEKDDDPLAVLDRFLKSPSRHHQRQRQAYGERLASFAAPTYLAKPASLSPLVCARFGWRNVDTDLLQCDNCQACVAITYRPGLSTFATDTLTCKYERQLGIAHKETCRFRTEAMKYFERDEEEKATTTTSTWGGADETTTAATMIVPSAWSWYFPSNLMELVESSQPVLVLGQQVQSRLAESIAWERISFEKHPSMISYQVPGDATESFEEYLVKALTRADFVFDNVSMERVQRVLWMVVLGWKAKSTVTEQSSSITLQCELCQKASEVPYVVSDAPQDDTVADTEPATKRLRSSTWDPLMSHRYYCPYVCGFPRQGAARGTPLWRALADRLVERSKDAPIAEGDTSGLATTGKSEWVQANALLNAGISRKGKMQLSK